MGTIVRGRFRELTVLTCLALAVSAAAQTGGGKHYVIHNGLAIFEGDIILGKAEDVEREGGVKSGLRGAMVRTGEEFRWPGGRIPFEIDSDIPSQDRIQQAIAAWNANTPIRLEPRQGEANYVRFIRQNGNGVCFSALGMVGGEQTLLVDDTCVPRTLAHEIGHAVGLHHEQSREDRDAYVDVIEANFNKNRLNASVRRAGVAYDSGYYDFASVMQYARTAGSKSLQLPTHESKPPGYVLGAAFPGFLSLGDIDAVTRMYSGPPRQYTVAAHPIGLAIAVDGVAFTGSRSFDWTPGSVHTLSVPNPVQNFGTIRFVFGGWNDLGAASHTIVADPAYTVYTANFSRQFFLGTGVTPADSGRVEIQPPSADGFYTDGEEVRLMARPADGFRFANWTGAFFTDAGGESANPLAFRVVAANDVRTAGFTRNPLTTITTDPPNLIITVDGTNHRSPRSFEWQPGTTHTITVAETINTGGGTRYVFENWSDPGDRTHSFAAGPEGGVVTARLRTRHELLAFFTPGGTIEEDPPAPDGYHDAGTVVRLTATPSAGFRIASWTGDVSGFASEQTIVMTGQKRALIEFRRPLSLSAAGALHGASGLPGPIAPGQIVVLTVLDAGPAPAVTARPDAAGNLPETLNGVRVFFDDLAAQLLSVERDRVVAIAPLAIAGRPSVQVVVESGGQRTNDLTLRVTEASPGIFAAESPVMGPAVVNEDGSANSPANPAARGSAITFHATGAGTDPGGSLRVSIAGRDAPVRSVGPAADQPAGVTRISAVIPELAPVGDRLPLVVWVGDSRSPAAVFVSVK